MSFFKKREQQVDAGTAHLAGRIAEAIVRWQLLVSGKMNQWANRHSTTRQKQLLGFFCAVSAASIMISVAISMKYLQVAVRAPHYQPAYIGRPFAIPKLRPGRKTDSLTNKK